MAGERAVAFLHDAGGGDCGRGCGAGGLEVVVRGEEGRGDDEGEEGGGVFVGRGFPVVGDAGVVLSEADAREGG